MTPADWFLVLMLGWAVVWRLRQPKSRDKYWFLNE